MIQYSPKWRKSDRKECPFLQMSTWLTGLQLRFPSPIYQDTPHPVPCCYPHPHFLAFEMTEIPYVLDYQVVKLICTLLLIKSYSIWIKRLIFDYLCIKWHIDWWVLPPCIICASIPTWFLDPIIALQNWWQKIKKEPLIWKSISIFFSNMCFIFFYHYLFFIFSAISNYLNHGTFWIEMQTSLIICK